MTDVILPLSSHDIPEQSDTLNQRMEVVVHIRAEVLHAEVAMRVANEWLLERVGNWLSATTPELILGERLFWRYDVVLGLPNPTQPGSGALYRIGQILLDAATGEIHNADTLAQELLAQKRGLE
jgi:hypothetical protein